MLLVDGGNREEWSVSGRLQVDPHPDGSGLWLSGPAWGQTHSRRQVWEGALTAAAPSDQLLPGRLDGELGYGIATAGGAGVLTPSAGLTVHGTDSQRYRLGLRLQLRPSLTLMVAGERHAFAAAAPDHALTLQGQLRR